MKRIIAFILFSVCVFTFCSCESNKGNEALTSTTSEQYTTEEITTNTTETTTTTKRTSSTRRSVSVSGSEVTPPEVNMPNDNTAWANYIVDSEYNYIADLLTNTQKSNVQKMATTVGCKVVFEENETLVTDTQKNTVVYSKTFPDDLNIDEPNFGALTLTRKSDDETLLIYKVVGIQHFVNYTNLVKENSFCYNTNSSADYLKKEAIFVGENEQPDFAIVKLKDDMLIISIKKADLSDAGDNNE